MKITVSMAFILATVAGAVYADTLALVAADSTRNENAAQQAFTVTGKFSSVAVIDTQTSTPDLATLGAFTHVLAWSAAAPFDRVALGDVLANFFDLGGKHLTVATYAFSTIPLVPPFFLPNPEIQGRITTAPYAAFTNVKLNGDLSGSLVFTNPNDPIAAGIDPTKIFYFENQYSAHPDLAAGGTLIAADGGGSGSIALIARSQNGVVNVNFYPGGPQGETAGNNNAALFTLMTNTLVGSQTGNDTTPPVTSANVQPAPNAKGWNNSDLAVLLTAVDNAGGSGVKQISVTQSGAQTGSTVFAGNSASVPVTTEASTTLAYFSTDNAGNAEAVKSITVLLDKTPPAATATASPLPNATGWNDTDVTVTFTGTDSLSGVASCTAPVTLNTNGAGQVVNGVCTDNAGNVSAPVSLTINIDKTVPAINGAPAPGSCVLWPPNGRLVQVAILAPQGGAASFTVTGTSNPPADSDSNDIVILGSGVEPRTILLRARRLGHNQGRIYTITAIAANRAGDTAVQTFSCTVPHDESDSTEDRTDN